MNEDGNRLEAVVSGSAAYGVFSVSCTLRQHGDAHDTSGHPPTAPQGVAHVYEELYIRTQCDGRDLMSVEEIFYYDDEGDKQTCEEATNACIDITTCADQGSDLWSWLREQVERRLRDAGISSRSLYFEDERGDHATF